MPHQGQASETKLEDVRVGTGSKTRITVILSGESLDRAAAYNALDQAFPEDKFPGRYLDSETVGKSTRGKLTLAIPTSSDEDALSATDIVEKVFDATHCDLGFQCNAVANERQAKLHRFHPDFGKRFQPGMGEDGPTLRLDPNQGGWFMPEVVISLDNPKAQESLLGRTVLDVIERKLQPNSAKATDDTQDSPILLRFQSMPDDPMIYYLCTRSPDNTILTVGHLTEIHQDKTQALEAANDMMAHCKQKLGIPSADIRLTGMEGDLLNTDHDTEDTEENLGYTPPQPITITLSGNEEALARAQLKLNQDIDLELELIAAKRGQPAQLRITKTVESMDGAIALVRQVHMAAACELPVKLQYGVAHNPPDAQKHTPATYQPSVLLWFEDTNAHYNDLLIQALSKYVSIHMKGTGEFQVPLITGRDGESVYDSTKPIALIHDKPYQTHEDAEDAAKDMTTRLKRLLQFDAAPFAGMNK